MRTPHGVPFEIYLRSRSHALWLAAEYSVPRLGRDDEIPEECARVGEACLSGVVVDIGAARGRLKPQRRLRAGSDRRRVSALYAHDGERARAMRAVDQLDRYPFAFNHLKRRIELACQWIAEND